jgi:hypothetical protein
MTPDKREPVLCYVDGSFAYFTTQELAEQWGDDWNDAPYEHNAGRPYEWTQGDECEPWEIVKVAFDGDLETPSEGYGNSPYSVQAINAGVVAWLRSCSWRSGEVVAIPAGVTIERFAELVRKAGGRVYLEAKEAGR